MHIQILHKRLMAPHAVRLDDRAAPFGDLDWLVKILKSETLRMAIAMFYFREVLTEKVLRNMAVITCGDIVVGRFHPTFELVTHDVTVDASLGIIRQVRSTLSVMKGE
jgi:hypothetical protein